MSVINETLENLKKPKKCVPESLNPSSSVYCESPMQRSTAMKSFATPVSIAVFIGVFMYMSYSYFSSPTKETQLDAKSSGDERAEISRKSSAISASADKKEVAWVANPLAQGLYYEAMNLLNEGKEEQALQSLRNIINQYPEFTPAQKVYSMLTTH